MKKFMKRNKHTIVALGVFLAFIFLAGQLYRIFVPELGSIVYGDRLDGIEEVMLSTTNKENLVSALESDDRVTSASVNITGRIIRVFVTVDDYTTVEEARGVTYIILDTIDEDQIEFFDIEVLIEKGNEDTRFPIIGYKQNIRETFSWTRDRE